MTIDLSKCSFSNGTVSVELFYVNRSDMKPKEFKTLDKNVSLTQLTPGSKVTININAKGANGNLSDVITLHKYTSEYSYTKSVWVL